MTAITTNPTRRTILAGAAIVAAAPVAAVAASPVAIGDALASLIATYDRCAAEEARYHDTVFEPLAARYQAACDAIPHVTSVPIFQKILTSAKHYDIDYARDAATSPYTKYAPDAQRFVEAAEARQAKIDAMPLKAELERARHHADEVIGEIRYAAACAVTDYQPKNLPELHAKLAFMIKVGTAERDDTTECLLADIGRILNKA